MITFRCGHCGKSYEFKFLPIPDGGADFQCSECGKTSKVIRKGNFVFCVVEDGFKGEGEAATMDLTDSFRSGVENELSDEEVEARLQGLYADLPFDMEFLLGVTEGLDNGTTFPIRSPVVTIGKTGCDINLKDPNISREHCQIEFYGNQMIILRDLSDMGTTYRNGYPTTLASIRPGDTIQLGKTKLVLIQNPKKIEGKG
ncbi:FHA domain-containing protein [bacterium]|nr:FHA domain-containing protein [candidate division CSSED10-310 bacterium]